MSLADLNAKIAETKSSKVKEEPALELKKPGQKGRARVAIDADAVLVKTPPAKIKSVLDALTDEDRMLVIVRLRETLNAERRSWNMTTKRWDYEPDSLLRFKGLQLALAYLEGMPVARTVSLSLGHEELKDVLARAKESPATLDALRMLGAGHLLGVQKTGPEKRVSAPSQESAPDDVQ